MPGVLGNEASLAEESFVEGLLEQPQYTRPRDWEGRTIPEVLLSGDHAKIAAWRREARERSTRERRPDLIQPDNRPREAARDEDAILPLPHPLPISKPSGE
jgi:tRNA (guanine37-N1)-methyltransferase